MPPLEKNIKHDILVVIDRISIPETKEEIAELKERLANSVEIALKQSDGILIAREFDTNKDKLFSERFACPVSGFCIEKIEPRLFSFNAPMGACKDC